RPAHKTAPRFVTFKPEGPPDALFVNAVLEETGGSVLVGTAVGLYRLRLNSHGAAAFERIDFKPPRALPNGPAVNTLLIAGGAVWVGAASGVYRQDASGKWTRLAMREDCRTITCIAWRGPAIARSGHVRASIWWRGNWRAVEDASQGSSRENSINAGV